MEQEKTCFDCIHSGCDYDDYGVDLWCKFLVKDLESQGIEPCEQFEEGLSITVLDAKKP